AGSGAAIGFLLGGALTQYLAWRWCLFVNLPIAAVAAVGSKAFLPNPPASAHVTRLDIPGVVLVAGALVALVEGCTLVVSAGWSAGAVAARRWAYRQAAHARCAGAGADRARPARRRCGHGAADAAAGQR